MGQRQCASLWFYLGFWKNYAGKGKNKWRFPDFFKHKVWKNEYFMKDTFYTPWNKFLGCKLFGHRKIKFLWDDCGDGRYAYCFSCCRKVNVWAADDPHWYRSTFFKGLIVNNI